MYKKILFIAYVIGVLVASGLYQAQASTLEVKELPITTAEYDAERNMIFVEGYHQNACLGNPKPVLVQHPEVSGALVLKVIAEQHSQFCIQTISGKYQLVFDLRSVLPEMNGTISTTLVQPIYVSGTSLIIEKDPSSGSAPMPFSTVEVEGLVKFDGETFSLTTQDGQVLKLVAVAIDLADFVNGKLVKISGHLLNHRVPVLKPSSFNPLNSSAQATGKILVSGISTTLF